MSLGTIKVKRNLPSFAIVLPLKRILFLRLKVILGPPSLARVFILTALSYTNGETIPLKEFSGFPDRSSICPETVITESAFRPVSYTHLRAHETRHDLVC